MITSVMPRAAFVALAVTGLSFGAPKSAAACERWLMPLSFTVVQNTGNRVSFQGKQEGSRIHGYAMYKTTKRIVVGNFSGSIVNDVFHARVLWTYSGVSSIGQYNGKIRPNHPGRIGSPGFVEGTTYDEYIQPPDLHSWYAYNFTCQPTASEAPAPVRSRGEDPLARKRYPGTRILDSADEAIVDGPYAVAQQEQPGNPDVLAARGYAIASQEPLAVELRNLQPDGPARRGFDIGMAVAEKDTLPGPGKDRIRDSLSPDEQAGFNTAVSYSLARNRQKITDLASNSATADPPWAEAAAANPGAGAPIIPGQMQSGSFDALKDSLRTQPDNSIRVQVRYPVAYGYKDAAGLFDPSPNSCGAFRIDIVGLAYVPGRALTGIATQPHMRTSNGMYVCDYLVSDLPLGEPLTLRVAMSNQGAAASETWLGGSHQPSGGQRRTIVNGDRQLTLSAGHPRASEVFDMVYAGGVSDLISDRVTDTEAISATRVEPPICNNARQAIARNSPAAPGLSAQCRAAGGTLPDPPICTNARKAAARNSPATPGLTAQCRAAGGVL